MKKIGLFLILLIFFILNNYSGADRTANSVMDNQLYSIETIIESIGMINENSDLNWIIADGTVKLSGVIFSNHLDDDGIYPIGPIAYYNLNNLSRSLASEYGGIPSDYIGFRKGNFYDIFDYALEYWYFPDDYLQTIDGGFDYAFGFFLNDYSYVKDYKKIISSPSKGKIKNNEIISNLIWKDSIKSNGGLLYLNKNILFNTQDSKTALTNLKVEKVFTYSSSDGNHLIGTEEWIIDQVGGMQSTTDNIRCVFASAKDKLYPAFCNSVKAKSEIININNAQISTKGSSRLISSSDEIPLTLNYNIAISPNIKDFAEGTIRTMFSGTIIESRRMEKEPSITNFWKDSTVVTRNIKNFQKSFKYESGITL